MGFEMVVLLLILMTRNVSLFYDSLEVLSRSVS